MNPKKLIKKYKYTIIGFIAGEFILPLSVFSFILSTDFGVLRSMFFFITEELLIFINPVSIALGLIFSLVGYLNDRLGKKTVLLISSIIYSSILIVSILLSYFLTGRLS